MNEAVSGSLASSQSERRQELELNIDRDGLVAVDALSEAASLPKQRVKQAMTKGAVWLSKGARPRRLRRAKTALRKGDTLYLYYDPVVLARETEPARLVADEGDYTVWYKPFGVLAQGSKWGDHCAITRIAEKQLSPERPALVVHRLDRAANGLMLLAHTKRAAARLSQLFQSRTIEKRYRALAHGALAEGAGRKTLDSPVDGREAVTHYEVIATGGEPPRSLLDLSIETGRKHQIRVHLAELGHPIVGDRLYGTGKDEEDLCLTAYRLAFRCPLTDIDRSYELPESDLPTFSPDR